MAEPADPTDQTNQGQQEAPRKAVSPLDALRIIQESGAQLLDATRRITKEAAQTPLGLVAEPLARYGEYLADLSTMWVNPLRTVLEEQQQLADLMANWAKQQQELARSMSQWADRHRAVVKQLSEVLEPILDTSERAGQMTRSFAHNMAQTGDDKPT
jgi:hypothetical protein